MRSWLAIGVLIGSLAAAVGSLADTRAQSPAALIFASDRAPDRNPEVYSLDLARGARLDLSRNDLSDTVVAVQGRQVAFESDRRGLALYVARVGSASAARRLATLPASDALCERWILAERRRAGGRAPPLQQGDGHQRDRPPQPLRAQAGTHRERCAGAIDVAVVGRRAGARLRSRPSGKAATHAEGHRCPRPAALRARRRQRALGARRAAARDRDREPSATPPRLTAPRSSSTSKGRRSAASRGERSRSPLTARCSYSSGHMGGAGSHPSIRASCGAFRPARSPPSRRTGVISSCRRSRATAHWSKTCSRVGSKGTWRRSERGWQTVGGSSF